MTRWESGNYVILMLLHNLFKLKNENTRKFPKNFQIHADDCPAQNKNRFLISLCPWLVCTKLFDEVEMLFLVPSRKKNICDGFFGLD